MTTQRRRGKTAILTGTPYKKELESILLQKSEKAKGVKRNIVSKCKGQVKNKKTKKSADYTSSEEDEKNKENEVDTTLCVYCEEIYPMSTKTDGWVKCTSCKNWAHEGCTGWLDEDLNEFQCDTCLEAL
ncbi:unnamed protein product [Acanthoscelides obtectus]|uniref:Zinc finger PHD-type domain-containing protein n=1 Tax=Acanthoscelides obtectus TaxID=200917 RepID=A0A9P0K7L9_ACAOB|nr:unnamed protein product [Acanthoscelides obtectus]CAK1627444.1 hypothetical protein AOBTE_LOCUS4606 [Acanthoscelides obtectus]